MRKTHTLALLVLSHVMVAWMGYEFALSRSPHATAFERFAPSPVDQVLDGDTVVKNGVAFHVLGMDAPELGPWANCWAEAALAGHARSELEALLHRGKWKVVESHEAERSVNSVDLIRDDGETVREAMVVGGYAAETAGHWDWCKSNAGLHPVLQGEPAPRGPSLWWPTGAVFDPLASD